MIFRLIKYLTSLLYPFIYVYDRFISVHIEELHGKYVVSRIKNKGIDVRVHGRIIVHDYDQLKVGSYTRFGRNCFLFCKGGLLIGDNVQFSRNITVYTANHNFKSDTLPYDNTYILGKVVIGNNVWVGMNVSILPNVTIGDNAIIGLGAVITKDIPANAIVVGNNRIIGYRDNQQIYECEKFFGKIYADS